jgi:hypothetical protein
MGPRTSTQRDKTGSCPERLSMKDYYTITVSTLALIISGVTAYFNIFRTQELVAAVVHNYVGPMKANDQTLYITSSSEGAQVAFINSGTVSVLISHVQFLYVQPDEGADKRCPLDGGANFFTDFESAAVKPNDVLVKKVKITKSYNPYSTSVTATPRDGAWYFPIRPENSGKPRITVDICLDLLLSTPSEYNHHSVAPLIRYYALLNDVVGGEGATEPEQPAILINKTGNIFTP